MRRARARAAGGRAAAPRSASALRTPARGGTPSRALPVTELPTRRAASSNRLGTTAGRGGSRPGTGWKGPPGSAARAPGRSRVTNLRYRTTSVDSDDRAAQPAGAVPERDRAGRGCCSSSSVGFLVRARPRRRAGPQLALALALPAYFLHGLLDLDWDFLAVSALVFFIAGALVVRPPEVRGVRAPSRCSTATGSCSLPASRSSLCGSPATGTLRRQPPWG